jgi:4-diphosphocytidyl-2-C-methyl-D-erythritol kinase
MITLSAPAKINWSLYVLGKREDGYHNIISLMQCIGLYDTLTFEQSPDIELHTDMEIPAEQNLVYKAAIALRKAAGTTAGARINLQKEIPSGAGLGGGSSDAAFALIGLNRLWALDMGTDALKRIGASLGSDVPFFFHCPAAIVSGRGDKMQSEHIIGSRTLLLVKPEVSIPTVWAYKELADSRLAESAVPDLTNKEEKLNNIKLIIEALNEGRMSRLRPLLQNDFEGVVTGRHQVIAEIRERMFASGASAALLSGSGSAVFGLFDDIEKADRASQLFSSFWNRVVATI